MEIKFRKDLGDLLDHFGLVGASAEIGVAEGRFSEEIISWPTVTKHYMVDAWQHLNQKGDGHQPQSWHDFNYSETLRRTEAYEYKREIIRAMSTEGISLIPDDSLVLAYVDADHSYEGCLRDLVAIWPKIKSGGILSGHDYLNKAYGVNKAVKDFACDIVQSNKNSLSIRVIPDEDESMASFWIRKK